ncbi:hypothetical protein C8Q80DRAFT_1269341 [Daedaleopsis nitida]|nr:hypothetical protein C8Q80DRAFT_1269341 [Daedaleopsis nitida]
MTLYFDSLRPLLPDAVRTQLDHALSAETKAVVDAMLRLVVGAEAPASNILPGWENLQPRASKIVDDLKRGELTRSSQKRSRDDDSASSSKRPRTDGAAAGDDERVFSLQGISVSTPIRKKVNIDVHSLSIRLTNPSTHKDEFPPIPLSALQRAFLLPTRGKSKPHWTVVLLSTDVPPPAPKGPGAAAAAKETTQPQLVFGLDATLTTILNTSTPDTTTPHAKGQPSLPALRAFLSHLPISTIEPSTRVFKSAAGSQDGDGVAGVEAYRGAKEGTLWFLDGGVLWDGKPCEFFALEHLAPAAKGDQPVDGVRTLTATGRTCSVILRRIGGGSPAQNGAAGATGDSGKKSANGKGKQKARSGSAGEGDGEDGGAEEEAEAVDVDFGMVDGREQEPIGRWIKARRHRFGHAADPAAGDGQDGGGSVLDKGKGKAVSREADPRNEDTDDEEDEDFTMDSDVSDQSEDEVSGSDASQDGDRKDGDGGSDDEDEDEDDAEGAASGDEMDAEDADDAEELDPKYHPLLRPGAMPRMSRAAVDAVVGMVAKDLVAGGSAAAAIAVDSEEDEDEEDELDD